MQEKRFRESRGKLALYALGSAAFVAAAVVIMVSDPPSNPRRPWLNGPARPWIALACILFFGFGLIVFLFRMFRPGNDLVLDSEGLHLPATWFAKTTFIRWPEIVGISVMTIRRTPIISLTLRDADAYLAGLSGLHLLLARVNIVLMGSQISVSGQLYDASPQELAQEIDAWRERYGFDQELGTNRATMSGQPTSE